MKYIIASGPVIIENGKLLVTKDEKDDFYKLIGGNVKEDEELERTCVRRAKEECLADVEIIKPLHPMILWKNPQTSEKMCILLIHYLAILKNSNQIKPIEPIKEIQWLGIQDIKSGKYNVAPNIKFLIEKGDIQ